MQDDLILCLDASGSDTASWAVVQKNKIVFEEMIKGRASASLFSSLEKKQAVWGNAKKILVGIGPGSFSGIRVAIAAAQGFKFTLHCEITPVYSSNAFAYENKNVSLLGVFAPARKDEFFVTFYKQGKLARPPQIVHADELDAYLSKCSLAVSAEDIAGISHSKPIKASCLALHYLEFKTEMDLLLEPFYIQPTASTL